MVEKNKVESQKSGLEKENSNLKDKSRFKNKTQNLKMNLNQIQKIKITYSDSKDIQKIQEHQIIETQHEKER